MHAVPEALHSRSNTMDAVEKGGAGAGDEAAGLAEEGVERVVAGAVEVGNEAGEIVLEVGAAGAASMEARGFGEDDVELGL